ncbi:BTAD domain-containing putative transcriptional regulator [Kutzneria sp. 744]|uniref:AfsR/SARP family transcriptional regulator n=1 Tax=Kutzneria sp. (strain 744) TaxID=345341 RepID=UPI0012F7C29B|nr:BTAD domain-containing putative transcriptional regulator [Kutzneria sp. 744]
MELRLLGPVEARVGDTAVSLGPRQNRLVLAVLACDVNRLVSVDRLVEWVWPVDPPSTAAHAIRVGVSRLRSRLAETGAEVTISTQGPGYVLRADPMRIDVHRFQSLIDQARSTTDDRDKVRLLEQALGLWTGPALADTATDDVRDRLCGRFEEARLAAVEDRFACLLRLGQHEDLLGELRAFAEAHPTRERAWAQLVLGLYRSDRQSDALAALRRVRALLAEELGIDPGGELRLLESRVLRQDPQLLLGDAAPTVRPRPTRPLSAFLGREREMRTLSETLDSRRLVTMVGPGGVGKTRLAVEHAAERQDPHGPWLVRLADVRQAKVVAHAVADAIGASDISTSTQTSVIRTLAARPGLLVLDNCEHLVDAVAELVVELLDRCPDLRVLATSREPLGIDGETVVPVLPLPVYEDDGTDGPAVRLLLDRISAARAGWSPSPADTVHMRQLCAALDGLPLALELAAAPATVLGLAEIVARLDHRFAVLGSTPRGSLTSHANLQAAIAWSVEQLAAGDRALLTRLWPFEGGFSLEAAEAVGPGDGRTVESLSALVSRSVVTADTTPTPTRYRLLETIRAYCQEQDSEPAATLEAHARWCRALVDQHWAELPFALGGHSMRVLTRELPNIRGCIAHDLEHTPASALRTVGRLDWFWIRSGHFAEASRLLDTALSLDKEPSLDRVQALTARGNLLLGLEADPADAFACFAEASGLSGASDDVEHRVSHGRVLFMSAFLLRAFGELDRALEASRRTVAIGRELGVDWLTSSGLANIGATLVVLGRVAEGERALVEAAEVAERDSVIWPLAYAKMTLGQSLVRRAAAAPDPVAVGREALDLLCTAVHWFVRLEDQITVMAAVNSAAAAFAHIGAAATALSLAAGVRRQCDDFGLSVGYLSRFTAVTSDMPSADSLSAADRAAAEAAGAALRWPELVDLLWLEAKQLTSVARG